MIDIKHICYVTRSSFPYIYLFSHLFTDASIAIASLKWNQPLPGFSHTTSLLFRCGNLFNRCLSAHSCLGRSGGQGS